ncbi:hypothetical protein QYF61_021276 [Mycteria americana]|uniref:SRCR domain-containing protein n=1 Tax=Mycteria americana TaxID=33587 RepID=A0AAN7RPU9_MYCAM|nr:hypothetical protein QYF61_021276 [Mycteria americana]
MFEGAAEVRRANGGWRCAGRVEVKHQGWWGTVCSFLWDMNDTAVVCKQLGCGSALEAPTYGHFGAGSGPIWMDEVDCHGTESALSDCTHSGWGIDDCDHSWDAGVTCSGFVQLVGGHSPCSGRVEIRDGNQWKTVCDSDFGPKAADVVCREFQCGTALSVPGAAHFGEGAGAMWDRELQCVGNESLLIFCPRVSPRDQPCTHANATGVTCTRPDSSSSLRLVGGGSRCDGRVEILQRGTWGRVLDDQWDMQTSVVCRQLQCGEAEAAYIPPKPQRGTGPVGLRGVWCAGHEAKLTLCNTSVPESALAAGIAEDVGVVCWGSWQVRLVNGPGRCAGRVEIYYQGSWGTICDHGWDLPDATVVCHQLGCGGAAEAVGSALFGKGSGWIWLQGMNCSRAEAALWDCLAGSWAQDNCGRKEDAGVVCSEFVALRLENSSNCSGRLQVFYNGTWGSVCLNSMTPKTVSLACKELGCGDGGYLEPYPTYGRLPGPAWLDRVQCGERNSSFWKCPSVSWDPRSCDDLRDEIHITCNGNSHPPSHQRHPSSCSLLGIVKRRDTARRGFSFPCQTLLLLGAQTGFQLSEPHTFTSNPVLPFLCSCHADPTPGRATGSGRVSLPIIICIILGALLCLLLALLAGQVRIARAGRRGSERAWEPFPDAVYEEIAYGPAWEKQARFRGSAPLSFQTSLSCPEVTQRMAMMMPGTFLTLRRILPGGDPADGYDDAREVSDPAEDPAPGQGDWEKSRVPEEGAGPQDASRGANLRSQRSAGVPGAEGDARSLSLESTGYDDAEDVSPVHSPEGTKAVTPELSAQQSLSPGHGEPVPAVQLGAASQEERSVQLGKP